MKVLDRLHESFIYQRRISRLSQLVSEIIPANSLVLDVGCGDGELAAALLRKRPDLHLEGVDVLVRKTARIPVRHFDGLTLPYADETFDVVMLVDVLHHTLNPLALLRECLRACRHAVLIKDHKKEGFGATARLRFMDDVGNARHSVALPYNYLSDVEWREIMRILNVKRTAEITKLGLYPWPASPIFDANLHFICLLERERG